MDHNPNLNRLPPKMPPQNYKQYQMRRPLNTHWRKATCEEVECDGFRFGFVTYIDTSTDLGQRQYAFLSKSKKRSFRLEETGLGQYAFHFPPGTICMNYDDHKLPADVPPILLVVPGDFRGNPMHAPVVRHRSVENWVEDFATHQDRVSTLIQRG